MKKIFMSDPGYVSRRQMGEYYPYNCSYNTTDTLSQYPQTKVNIFTKGVYATINTIKKVALPLLGLLAVSNAYAAYTDQSQTDTQKTKLAIGQATIASATGYMAYHTVKNSSTRKQITNGVALAAISCTFTISAILNSSFCF